MSAWNKKGVGYGVEGRPRDLVTHQVYLPNTAAGCRIFRGHRTGWNAHPYL
jgi:hypothetical protein